MPLIHAREQGTLVERQLIRAAIENGGREHIDHILLIIKNTGAIDYTFACAQQEREYAVTALKALPDSAYKTALHELADFSVERRS